MTEEKPFLKRPSFPELLAKPYSPAVSSVLGHEAQTADIFEIPIGAYPDGTPMIRWEGVLAPVERLLCRPTSLASFMATMFFVDACAERGFPPPELILPILPGARQDRLNPTGDYLFTAKSIAREINLREFSRVTFVDPHSDVTPALVDRSCVVHAADCITPPPNKYAAVVSPDAGAEKRASMVAKKLGVPLLHAWKTRNVTTGEISGFGMQQLPLDERIAAKDSLVLVVDDLCDGGGTFVGLGGLLKHLGLRAHLWTSHGLYTKGTKELLSYYGHLYCTDSAKGDREGVIEIPVCTKLLEGGSK